MSLTRNDAKLEEDRVGGQSSCCSQKSDSGQRQQDPLQVLASVLLWQNFVVHVRNVRYMRYVRMSKKVLVALLWEVHLLVSAENTSGELVMLLPR